MINAQKKATLTQSNMVRPLIFVTIGIYLVYIFASRLIELLVPNYGINSVIHIVLVASISFGIMAIAKKFNFHLNYSLGNLRGLVRVLPMVVIGMWYFFLNTLPQVINNTSDWLNMGIGKNMADVLYGISAGFWEETFLRGFLLAGLLLAFSTGKNAGIKAVIYSALIFGAMHITNLMNPGSSLLGVFQQMVYAAIFGVLFGVLYLHTHTLVYGIIIHSVYDFASFMSAPKGALAGDAVMQWNGFIVVFGSMLLVASFYLFAFRKYNQTLVEHIK